MSLTEAEEKFLSRRKKTVRFWPWAASAMILMVVGLIAWVGVNAPQLLNPKFVANGIGDGSLPYSTVQMMAVMVPILFIALLVMAVALICLATFAIHTEKKMLKTIDRLSGDSKD